MKRFLPLLIPALTLQAEAPAQAKATLAQAAPWPAETLQREVQAILAAPLTEEAAVRLAFLNNPRLKATYAELGVAEADLREAGLLSNPSFGASYRRGGEGTRTEFSLGAELVSLFTRGLRKRAAARQLDQARLQVAAAVLDLDIEVRKAFVEAQAAAQSLRLQEALVDLEEASLELGRRQRKAGNISLLTLEAQEAAAAQLRLDLIQAQLRVRDTREALQRLLGLFGPQTGWTLAEELRPMPDRELPLEGLEAFAVGRRFDLEVARQNREVIQDALRLARRTRFFGSVTLGVAREREGSGEHLTGPFLELELPLFNRGQAQMDRLHAQQQQVEADLTALAVEARSQVRQALDRLVAARETVRQQRDVLLPSRERAVAESQKHYNAMLIGVYDLIRAEQERNAAARGYLEALGAYWQARVELRHALGGTFPEESR